tara:strand:+ start:1640 stop:1957 length:318 start_codon:yes stop_codon:yes gene_type:complete
MTKMKVKKGDKVVVLTGKDKGKTGEVLKAIPAEGRVIVAGVNMVKKHEKPSQMSQGGIREFETSIDVSNLAHVDPKDGKATRVGFKVLKDGKKVRVSKRSGEVLD